jgi:hypothetical protein
MTKRSGPRQAVNEWLALHGVNPYQAECELKTYGRYDAPASRLDFIRHSASCLAGAVKDGMPRDKIIEHLMRIHQEVWHVHATVDPTAPTLISVREEWNENEELPAWTWMRSLFFPDNK